MERSNFLNNDTWLRNKKQDFKKQYTKQVNKQQSFQIEDSSSHREETYSIASGNLRTISELYISQPAKSQVARNDASNNTVHSVIS